MRTVQRSILDARRWLCLFMVCCFILCGIGGIHQRAQALVGVDDALVAIVIAGLAAVGITYVCTGSYSELKDYMGSLLEGYAASKQMTPSQLFNGCQAGAGNVGNLLINSRFVQLIDGFAAWIKATFSLVDNTTVTVVSPGTEINELTVYHLPIAWRQVTTQGGTGYYDFEWTLLTAPQDTFGIFVYNAAFPNDRARASLWLFNDVGGTVNLQSSNRYGSNNTTFTLSSNNIYEYEYNCYTNKNLGYGDSVSAFYVYTNDEVMAAIGKGNDINIDQSGVGIDIQVGNVVIPSDSPDYVSGYGASIDVSAPWTMTYPDIVSKWLPGEWTNSMAGDPSIAYETPQAIGQQVATGPDTASVSSEASDYQTPGLKDVFPFCLPFDVYNFLNCLAADPVAPSFTWRFYVPRLCDETFTVDLSPFDTVAQIVRTMELLAFCIGLAYVTREKFIRG